jgi:hypothetical protein
MRRVLYVTIALVGAGIVLTLLIARHPRAATANIARGPSSAGSALDQDVYVWQRRRTAGLRNTVAAASGDIHEFVFLATEISWDHGSLRQVDFPVAPTAAGAGRNRIGLAIRLGPLPRHATPEQQRQMIDATIAAARSAIASANSGGIRPAEVQIDFDSAESALAAYAKWLAEIRQAIAPVPLSFTALPAWLRHREFQALADSADGYVLQVHSLDRPARVTDAMTLCDPADAVRAVNRAATFGRRFRVALPTYGYEVAFDGTGSFAAISAEGPAPTWNADMTVRPLRADAAAMAGLVRLWSMSRPIEMNGVIWYRLPVSGDRLNWSTATWKSVMAGKVPAANLQMRVVHPQMGLYEIHLINSGDGECARLPAVGVDVPESPVGQDGINGFEAAEVTERHVTLIPIADARLLPGKDLAVAWLRFTRDAQVEAHVVAGTP